MSGRLGRVLSLRPRFTALPPTQFNHPFRAILIRANQHTASPSGASPPNSPPPPKPNSLFQDIWTLGKGRLSLFNAFATVPGYMITGHFDPRIVGIVAGTGLLAFSSQCANQIIERNHDSMMKRTAHRPLPSGRVSLKHAYGVTALSFATGMSVLQGCSVGMTASGIGLATYLSYLFLYTPLKRVTYLNTLAGAVIGALPPLIGYAAPTGTWSDINALLLAAQIFFWQIPHFYGIAWEHSDDYAKAGYQMIPARDPTGRNSSIHMMLASAGLTVVPLWLWHHNDLHWSFLLVSLGLLGKFVYRPVWAFVKSPSPQTGGLVFRRSMPYLLLVILSFCVSVHVAQKFPSAAASTSTPAPASTTTTAPPVVEQEQKPTPKA